MKRSLFALTLDALVWPAVPKAEAGVDVSVDFFYNNLGNDGNWVEVADYGYCWQPAVAVSNASWRPYADGYWAYTDVGWTWISYENFGWATYHYGRWARLHDHGWVWVPGYEWGPAWVSWRTGGDYVGWAPLPPRYATRGEVVYQGRPIDSRVDIEFDIGPAYYNFVNVRYIGEPLLRERIYAPAENITYITRTVNVTNITYNNSTVYNYGPDYNRLSAYSARPIQRLKLQRQSNIDYNAAAQTGDLTKVQGDSLVVAAPMTVQKSAQPIAPKQVKARLAKADLETGWTGVSDPKAKAQLQQKMKSEDSKTVPPPDMKPRDGAALETSASPAAPGNAAPADGETAARNGGNRGKGKNEPSAADANKPSTATGSNGTAADGTAPSPDSGEQQNRGKNKRGQLDKSQQAQPPVDVSPAAASSPAYDKAKRKAKRDMTASEEADSEVHGGRVFDPAAGLQTRPPKAEGDARQMPAPDAGAASDATSPQDAAPSAAPAR